jgi:hypothetical protein
MWKKLKATLFGEKKSDQAPASVALPTPPMAPPRPDLSAVEPAWVEAPANAFGVRVLDVRPVTLGTLSYTRDRRMAENAVSYGGEDGRSFAGKGPASGRVVHAALRFRAPGGVFDGALFLPGEMEDKWAVFVEAGELVLVRGWRREVFLRALITREGDDAVIGPLRGCVVDDDEGEAYTVRAAAFIVRTHALGAPWPAPLARSAASGPRQLAEQCMSVFGRAAHYASWDEPTVDAPAKPLRTMTRLHLAALSGDVEGAREALAAGIPSGQRDGGGAVAIHYVGRSIAMLECLLAAGADVDQDGDDGATALMLAAQERRPEMVAALLARGARAGAADRRGFTAMHRAAELGEVAIVRALLARGADPDVAGEGGHTARSLATMRGENTVLAVFAQGA